MKTTLIAAATLFLACFAGSSYSAQVVYPERNIRLVVPFPPGASTDILARLVGRALAEQLPGNVVVDNQPGANGKIGMEFVAKSPADGYTLLYNTSSFVLNVALYANPGYDPVRDFAPVTLLATLPLVYVAANSFPAANIQEFVTYAKRRPGEVTYGSAGIGNGTHLGARLFFDVMGINALHVPYKGGAPAIVDLVGGRVHFYAGSVSALLPFIKEKRLKPLAIASLQRMPAIPNVPTVHETVMPNFEAGLWQGIVAPAGTPAAIVLRIQAEIARFLKDAKSSDRFAAEGAITVGSTPEQYGAYIRSEIERWGKVVRDAGIKPE